MSLNPLFKKWFLFLLFPFSLTASIEGKPPFDYDLHFVRLPGKSDQVMITFHGMGGDWQIAPLIKEFTKIDETIIGFNFPDHGIRTGQNGAEKTRFGTIDEILPAIYVLKKVVVEGHLDQVDLYGFSAGGGAIINTLAILNSAKYNSQLQKIGVTEEDKSKILKAIQKGTIILDSPLKSLREIVDFRGSSPDLEIIAKRYRENQMEPIAVIPQLGNLSLNIIVHFQVPDEILSNRDDEVFIERLKKTNVQGKTTVSIGDDGGHAPPHPSLWKHIIE